MSPARGGSGAGLTPTPGQSGLWAPPRPRDGPPGPGPGGTGAQETEDSTSEKESSPEKEPSPEPANKKEEEARTPHKFDRAWLFDEPTIFSFSPELDRPAPAKRARTVQRKTRDQRAIMS